MGGYQIFAGYRGLVFQITIRPVINCDSIPRLDMTQLPAGGCIRLHGDSQAMSSLCE